MERTFSNRDTAVVVIQYLEEIKLKNGIFPALLAMRRDQFFNLFSLKRGEERNLTLSYTSSEYIFHFLSVHTSRRAHLYDTHR